MLGAPADLLSLLYLTVALYTLWQLPGRWRSLTDETYTDEDRNLANRVGFLMLTPLGVLIHELAHMAAATLLGGRDISLSYRVYWGYVQYRGQVGPTAEWIIASAGPGASLLLGLVVGYASLRLRQPWRDIGMSFAHATLLLDLILYPGMSLVDGVGDFRWVYSQRTPTLSVVAGVVHVAGLIAYIALARLQSRQNRREARDALTERFVGQQVTLRSEILARLDDLEAAERVRRLEPEERELLNQLRELRAWSAEHNEGVASQAALPEPGEPGRSLPEPRPPGSSPPGTNGTGAAPDAEWPRWDRDTRA
jgi:hypothetical protein